MTKSNAYLSLATALIFTCGTTPAEFLGSSDVESPDAIEVTDDPARVPADAETDPGEDPASDAPPDLPRDSVVPDAPVDDVSHPRDASEDSPDAFECPDGPGYAYESDDPGYCAEVGLHCEFPGDVFSNPCGCGCYFPRTEDCLYEDLGVFYQKVGEDPGECATIFFGCEEGGEAVEDSCGCGCVYGPPVCLDPSEPGVSYVGSSPQECEIIDFDCNGAGYFNNPCGCGCIEDRCVPNAARGYTATTFDECELIDFICPEGWNRFDIEGCGCGCEVVDCPVEEFLPPSGLASPIEVDGACDSLVACSRFSLDDGGTSDPFTFFYPDATCRSGSSSGCPRGTESYCEVPLGILEPPDIAAVCSIGRGSATTGLLCSGDR